MENKKTALPVPNKYPENEDSVHTHSSYLWYVEHRDAQPVELNSVIKVVFLVKIVHPVALGSKPFMPFIFLPKAA